MGRIEDGTEYREATIRVREGDLKLLVDSLTSRHGFCRVGSPRISILEDDGQLYIQIPSNTGRADGYIFLGLDIFVDIPDLLKKGVVDETPDPVDPGDGTRMP